MSVSIDLGRKSISRNEGLYVIAEIGVNHGGSMDLAKELINAAKRGGADAAKFQTYKAETIAAKNSPSYWDVSKEKTRSQYELFKKYDSFGQSEYETLAAHCESVGIDFLSTPFDSLAVEFLAPLMPFFKIASADITNVPLLRQVSQYGKPIVLSTGASTLGEIRFALGEIQRSGCRSVALLHCVLNYPTLDEHANLSMIEGLKDEFPGVVVGYSDHTQPDSEMFTLTTAYHLGARIIEKHFTHDKSLPGNDHYHAMDERDLRQFLKKVDLTDCRMGARMKMPLPSEEISRRNARRSLVTRHEIPAGKALTEADLIPKRPGTGISPRYFTKVLGHSVRRKLEADHILSWTDLNLALKETSVGMIQARVGSSRFPRKMLAKLGEKTLLEWVVSRVVRASSLDHVVVLTSTLPENDEIEQISRRAGVSVFRGSEEDVLSRFVEASERFRADIVVRICADNPFVDPVEIDRIVNAFKDNRPDYAFNHIPAKNNKYADGFGAEVLSRETLTEINHYSSLEQHREHVTSFLWEHPHLFDIFTLEAPKSLQSFQRFDIDTEEDLARLTPVANEVGILGSAPEFVAAFKAPDGLH